VRRNINIAVASVTLAALAAASGPVIGAAAAAPTSATTSSLAAFTLVAPTSQVPSGLLARAVIAAGAGCPLLTGTHQRLDRCAIWLRDRDTKGWLIGLAL